MEYSAVMRAIIIIRSLLPLKKYCVPLKLPTGQEDDVSR